MRRFTHMIHCAIACLAGATLLLASCERSDNPTGDINLPDMNTHCMLQPPTISVEPFGGNTPATRAAVAMKEERQAFNIGEELGNIITLGNSEPEDTPQTRAFAAGTYYRIVVYKLDDWNNNTMKVVEQRLCKTGSSDYFADLGDVTTPIYLNYGSYKIFCYSFNKATADKMAKLADGAANVPLSDGDDFLSAVIDKTITASQLGTNVALGSVTLQHRCCRLIGTLTAEAFTSTGIAASPTPSLSVTSTFNTAGNWSIKGSSFTGTATSGAAKDFALSKSGNDYIGTLLLLPLTSKSLSATYTFKPNWSSKNITASNKTVISSTTFSPGGSYAFIIKAIGAYVLTETNPVQIGSYKWAYANLDGQTKKQESKPWISGPLDGSSIPSEKGSISASGSDNDWWRWNVGTVDVSNADPGSASSWSTSTDPCLAGLGSSWRVPSKIKFDNLVGYKLVSKRVYINGETLMSSASGWVKGSKTVGCVFVDTSRGTCLFLPAVGDRYDSTYYELGTRGCYWSSTSNGSYYAYYVYFNSGDCKVGTSGYRTYGFSLRCSQ